MDTTLKTLYSWTVSLDQTVKETTTENRNGQNVQVTADVKKPVLTKMALAYPTRRQLRQAELFYGKRVNWYMTEGFLTHNIVQNKHANLIGGILSDKDKARLDLLKTKEVELQNDIVRAMTGSDEVKSKIQQELADVQRELINLYSVNEAVFSQTAESRAKRDVNDWLAYFLTLIEENGKLVPYFKGDTYEAKEEFMFQLEEKADEFYAKAAEKIGTYVYYYNMGLDKPEQFAAMDEALKKQLEAKDAAAKAAEPVAAPAEGQTPEVAQTPATATGSPTEDAL
jgi:hypothetical protein